MQSRHRLSIPVRWVTFGARTATMQQERRERLACVRMMQSNIRDRSDLDLLLAARAGDRDAFEELIARHYPLALRINRLLRGQIQQRHDGWRGHNGLARNELGVDCARCEL